MKGRSLAAVDGREGLSDSPPLFATARWAPPPNRTPLIMAQRRRTSTVNSRPSIGAGIQSFTIYVSDSGGLFALFLTLNNTVATSATFSAPHLVLLQHRARLVGNVEGPKTIAEATTQV